MKRSWQIAVSFVLILAFLLLSGFRAQTIIHDDGSETQDILKVSDSDSGQKALRDDADDFQKRDYMIMDYSNSNGEGFRAMKTITTENANRSSIDKIVHRTHDGLICTMYYIDYLYTDSSMSRLQLGRPTAEDGSDLEYSVSFPSGAQVKSNSTTSDQQSSTYTWKLSNTQNARLQLQATVWHKLTIYGLLFFIILFVCIVLVMEHRRRNMISWKQASRMRTVEIFLLLVPVFILGYMAYDYYAGTHITSSTLQSVAQQQEEEKRLQQEEERKAKEEESQRQREKEITMSKVRSKSLELSASLRELNRRYEAGKLSRAEARNEAVSLADQARALLQDNQGKISEADSGALEELVQRIVDEANTIASKDVKKVEKKVQPKVTNRSKSAGSNDQSGSRDTDDNSSGNDTTQPAKGKEK